MIYAERELGIQWHQLSMQGVERANFQLSEAMDRHANGHKSVTNVSEHVFCQGMRHMYQHTWYGDFEEKMSATYQCGSCGLRGHSRRSKDCANHPYHQNRLNKMFLMEPATLVQPMYDEIKVCVEASLVTWRSHMENRDK